MKLAIIKTGGKQYPVLEGGLISIEKLPQAVGDKVEFTDVLLLVDEDKITLGAPKVLKAKVTGEIIENGRSKKVTVIKYKSKTRYRVKQGHKQPFTKVKITKIDSGARS